MVIFQKQPSERYTIGVDFTGQLPGNALPASGTVTATDQGGADASATVLGSTVLNILGAQTKVLVKDGTHGENYKLRFLVTLDNGDILEEDLTMQVREL